MLFWSPMSMSRLVFLTGGTGYLGSRLAARLLSRGHEVRALVRPGSERRAASGCRIIPGDALDHRTYAAQVRPADTFVHLVGVSHPGPFVAAATGAGVRHFVYVSVAQPAPVMRAYVAARAEAEGLIRATGLMRRSCDRGTCSGRATGGRWCCCRCTG